MQVPAWHVRPVPQAVPSGWNVASVQTGMPESQLTAAVRAHGFVDWQATPAAAGHAMQAPPPHTRLVPQPVPSGIAAPASVHVLGVPQLTLPVWQGLVGMHAPAAQGAGRHEPLPQAADGAAQVEFVVPSGTLAVSRQTGTPVPQSIAAAATHAFCSVHGSPWVQAPHAPALQTRFTPQLVPLGWFPESSMHTEVPVEQEVVPV